MEKIYDIDISEIDFKGNQERMRKQQKRTKRINIIKNVLEFVLVMIIGFVVAFTPAIIELIY